MADTREHELRKLIREFSAEAASTNPLDLAKAIRKSSLHGSASEMASLIALTIPHAGINHVPSVLLEVVPQILENKDARIICDPWAGFGALVAAIQDALHPEQALAFSPNHNDAAVGQIIVETVQWKVGDALELLSEVNSEFDVVGSVLPFGLKSDRHLQAATTSGEKIELKDDLGRLILVAASQKLSADGIGLFVVTPSFFFSPISVLHHFDALGLGVEGAFAMPSGTFAAFTSIPTYLAIVRKRRIARMFVAELSNEPNTNRQIVYNFKQKEEGGVLELGSFVEVFSFRGLDSIRRAERFERSEKQFGAPAVRLEDLATAINLSRYGDHFDFPILDNSIFIPLFGISDVVDSMDDLTLRHQTYAQVGINPERSDARFVARFLNSEFGREIRELNKSGAVIPKLNKQTLKNLQIFIPDLATQKAVLQLEARIAAEHNTILALENDVTELRRDLWSNPKSATNVDRRLIALSTRLSGNLKQHAVERLEQWFETLPFPLASILRAWQATASQDFKTRYEHLLHFFEATAEFVSVIFLSAFTSNDALLQLHKQKLGEALQDQNLSFQRATFGTWKLVVEYFGKQTRQLLAGDKDARALCAEIFPGTSIALPEALSRKELAPLLSATNKRRNDLVHGGVIGQEDARLRNEHLLTELQNLREIFADTWTTIQMIRAVSTQLRRGVYENEIAILMGSNSDFLKESRSMSMCLDVEHLYLTPKEGGRALRLLPFIKMESSPQSAKNACYFFNKVERDGLKFVSYHYIDQPEITGQLDDVSEAMKLLLDT